ncbi:hypothetical protein [Longilinea arvoryzae]|nr:hypothetical protein [Longilinea arvoryzae]
MEKPIASTQPPDQASATATPNPATPFDLPPSKKGGETPAGTPTFAITPTPTLQRMSPDLVDASEIIDLEHVSAYPLGKIVSATIALDDDFIYWVDTENPKALYRTPLGGGASEKIIESVYSDGRLDCNKFQISEDWLVVCDTPTSNDLGEWKIRAVNLKDKAEILLLDDENGRIVFSMFDISLNGHNAIWTYARTTPDLKDLDEMVIEAIDFDTGERRELMRTKIEGSIWPVLSLSGNLAIVEQDFEDIYGGGTDLHLMDITDGTLKDLSLGEKSCMPEIAYPWAVWKSGARYAFWIKAVLHNLSNGQEFYIRNEGVEPSDPKIDGTRVYWTGSIRSTHGITNAIYIYDIGENKIYVLHAPGEDQYYRFVAIRKNTIAWVRVTEMSKAVSDIYLEWTTFR